MTKKEPKMELLISYTWPVISLSIKVRMTEVNEELKLTPKSLSRWEIWFSSTLRMPFTQVKILESLLVHLKISNQMTILQTSEILLVTFKKQLKETQTPFLNRQDKSPPLNQWAPNTLTPWNQTQVSKEALVKWFRKIKREQRKLKFTLNHSWRITFGLLNKFMIGIKEFKDIRKRLRINTN